MPSDSPDRTQATLISLLEPSPHRTTLDPTGQERFQELGVIAAGGMGEVARVRDQRLGRVLARKVLSSTSDPELRRRFLAEASITAQLAHPGVVPVHDVGELPDGRPYYTMEVVEGVTFAEAIRHLHHPPPELDARRWSFARLVNAFHRVCEAVSHAHARGVVHRDLKPANLMLGPFGQVVVVDWGLASPLALPAHPRLEALQEPGRSGTVSTASVAGTPAYMAPELLSGRVGVVVPAVDVYALGAVLYEILAGQPAYSGSSPAEVLRAVRRGPPPPPAGGPHPPDLVELCDWAMAREPSERPADAGVLAAAVEAWLDGARSRQRALELVQRADALEPQEESVAARARARRVDADRALARLPTSGAIQDKEAAWALQDEAAEIQLQAELLQVQRLQLLRAALAECPELAAAHSRLAAHFRARHARAEALRDPLASARCEALLRAHDRGEHAEYLQGRGTLSLRTEPDGARVVAVRQERVGRRLRPTERRSLGTTPLVRVPLPAGSWILEIQHPQRATVHFPVQIERAAHWDGAEPDGGVSPLFLPDADALGPEDHYVPAGFATLGDPLARAGQPRRRVWVRGFVMRRHPVSNREYIAFLDDLARRGLLDQAIAHVPCEAARGGDAGRPVYAWDAEGFRPVPDATGDLWDLDWPVVLIPRSSAMAWCRWEAERTGLPWRLPYELEREKAARGVDARDFPWGHQVEASWSRNHQSQTGRPLPARVGEPPEDVGPYGIRGLAGNVRDFCLDRWREAGPPVDARGCWTPEPAWGDDPRERYPVRGGGWSTGVHLCRAAHRFWAPGGFAHAIFGFRAARDI